MFIRYTASSEAVLIQLTTVVFLVQITSRKINTVVQHAECLVSYHVSIDQKTVVQNKLCSDVEQQQPTKAIVQQ